MFSTFDCAVKGIRKKEDPWNAIIAGFFTGGALAVRGGPKAIRNGAIGRAIRDNTVSGSALKVLASVDAVSDDVFWGCGGYCGKKQPMVVSMGGPAIRCQAQLGGS